VDSLRQQLEERRREIVREHEANLAAIDRLIALESGAPIPEIYSEIGPPRALVNVGARGVRPLSLTGQLINLMRAGAEKDWTCTELTKLMRDNPASEADAYHLPKDDLRGRNAVSAAMIELWRMGYIFRVSPSQGPKPAVYRLSEKGDTEVSP